MKGSYALRLTVCLFNGAEKVALSIYVFERKTQISCTQEHMWYMFDDYRKRGQGCETSGLNVHICVLIIYIYI